MISLLQTKSKACCADISSSACRHFFSNAGNFLRQYPTVYICKVACIATFQLFDGEKISSIVASSLSSIRPDYGESYEQGLDNSIDSSWDIKNYSSSSSTLNQLCISA